MIKSYLPLLLITVVAVILLIRGKSCSDKKHVIDQVQAVIDNKKDTARQWKDPSGRQHAGKTVPEASIAIVRAAYSREIDSLTQLLRIKENQILAFTSIATAGRGSVVPMVTTVITGDTCRSDFAYADKWITISGIIGPASVINYEVRDSLAVTTYEKKAGLFSPTLTYLDVFSLNPNVRVTGLTGFRVPVKQHSRFGIGPFIGYGYSFNRWAPAAGVSLHYSIIRF